MQPIIYRTKKGNVVQFDNYEREEDAYIVHLCIKCRNKYRNILRNELLMPDTRECKCSVSGCQGVNGGYMIDFMDNEVEKVSSILPDVYQEIV